MLSRLKIRTRMFLGFGALVLISLLMIGIGAFGLNVAQTSLGAITQQLIPVNLITARAKLALTASEAAEYEMVATMGNTQAAQEAKKHWDAQQGVLHKAVADFGAIAKAPDQIKSRDTFAAHLKVYREALEPVAAKLLANGYASTEEARTALAEADKGFKPAQAMLADIESTLEKGSAQIFARVAGAIQTILTILLGVGALGVGIALLLGWRMTHSVLRPVTEVASLAQRMADGDLTQAPRVEGSDELAAMTETLRGMQQSLAGIIHQVRESAEGIQLASAEVATGNHDLSARTEQAASNLQQTAASMEEMSGTVRQAAESARVARQLADVAGDSAQQGGAVVQRVVVTMGEIHEASSKINDIIAVIDGIAFQTNILALNAAVEAARAGEQGRGFAVVAGEVRALAQRSAQAAKEIKTLIQASVGKVGEGSGLVQQAGTTMREIVDNVARLRDIVGEISSTAAEQAEGINQINAAVSNLDQMTQQNAALVEQSAAAATGMSDQATQLTDVVKAFRIDGMGASAVSAVPARQSQPRSQPRSQPSARIARAAAPRLPGA